MRTYNLPTHKLLAGICLMALFCSTAFAKVVVFWQEGFPTIASQPVGRETLAKALEGMEPVFTDVNGLRDGAALADAELLVLPYGSATPAEAWRAIRSYVHGGGNMLILGGQALRVPVTTVDGRLRQGRAQDAYARELGIRHSYETPKQAGVKFAWKTGYSFLRTPEIRARRVFALQGRLEGLGYMLDTAGLEVAAPVVSIDHTSAALPPDPMVGSRMVMLGFEPEAKYWESADGILLIHETANYARQGATSFWLETTYSTLRPGETPQVAVHFRNARRDRLSRPQSGEMKIELAAGKTVLDTATVACSGTRVDAEVFFRKALEPGFYTIRGVYEDGGQPREFYQNGFWVEDEKLLKSGPVVGVKGDFLTRDGKPYFPVGTNYFTTDDDGWDFSGPRNAWVWDRDFDDMARHGVTFVRTGVWMRNGKFVEPQTGGVNERFLRNLEAYLLSARQRNIIVNFTFYSFIPHAGMRSYDEPEAGLNPYIDPAMIRAEQDYIVSVVNRFKDLPWVCWDLINEPSFSNPRRLWKGNTPNGDPAETAAWRRWLRSKYGSVAELAAAWSVTPEELGSLESAPLPGEDDLSASRYGNAKQVRAVDYNLFAQEMFGDWVRFMIAAIRGTGSKQLVAVGQDEGGVVNRVLNHFYATAGVAFTTNHTYRQDEALLWDSVAAKVPGVPNIVGETGYQPVWSPDGTWRYDEITGHALIERKWALGFAAGNSGALQWDWSRSADFGIKRSDGSAKIWQTTLRDMAQFAEKAAPLATEILAPQVAIVLTQSLQLSTRNQAALEAQQRAVRALYQYARAEAYVVGEYQIESLGSPRLIIVPSAFGLTAKAWEAIRSRVTSGATLLISGPFDGDAHFHTTGRQREIGLGYEPGPLTIREYLMKWAGGEARLTYGKDKTTFLDRGVLPDDALWMERTAGKGKILFTPLPLELNDNIAAVGDIYQYALRVALVPPAYSTRLRDPGILICPTRFPHATLYVLTSESNQTAASFRDQKSGAEFAGELAPGRAAMLLVGEDGKTLASYNWKGGSTIRKVRERGKRRPANRK